jgi:formylglycine-generating enzyme required for sulfatase activity/energy-coupling factor transporter ATP-binding protein EcfA2
MSDSPTSGDVSATGDIQARDIITGIQQNFTLIFQIPFTPPPDLETLRADYLAYLRDSYQHLDIKGIMQMQRVAPSIPLAAVYVPLKARPQRPDAGESWGRIAGRLWREENLPAEVAAEIPPASRTAAPVPVEVALQTEPAVVVLGDPGAGKSTLLKIIALALVEQSGGPLPILLPLKAYARRLLGKGEINLCDFLGEYYASRQKKLARVGELFEAALRERQAVILLDGLDEVQTERTFLVRLVQDFVAEFVPDPAETDQAIPGNRVVATSRIVGYAEAPLTGRQWRIYTLTDFDRANIERFVKQWTLAFELGVHGGDTPVAREAAGREGRDLLEAIFTRPSIERLAANPLLLTILALIKRTGVALPEQRVRLYELYLEALIESWNLARSLDQHPAGSPLDYLETVQVLAPLAMWLRETNPTAGLVARPQLEDWLTDYYQQEWNLSRGEARARGREFLEGVHRYSNLLVERGERQYGFLHLTLEEMLAAKGVAQLADESLEQATTLMTRHLADPAWHETLLLAVGAIGIVQQRPAAAGKLLLALLKSQVEEAPVGANVVLAGEALLDVGEVGVGRGTAARVTAALVETMQDPTCHIRERRDAGVLLGRLNWRPEPEEGDLLLAPDDPASLPTGLDAFRRVGDVWVGKYPVTNLQYARFVAAGGYDEPRWWTREGWAWRTGRYDSKAPAEWQDWLKQRPPGKRNQPFWWEDRGWNGPLQPVVGVTWFEALAYCAWLTDQLRDFPKGDLWASNELRASHNGQLVTANLDPEMLGMRLLAEAEWEEAMGGRGEYPWGETFDPTRLNCADAWAGRDLSDRDDWRKWIASNEWQEAGTTAVTTFPQGSSHAGVWDGSGNVWEWMADPYEPRGDTIALRGGSWDYSQRVARVSSRGDLFPDYFSGDAGFRVVVAPV